MTAGWDDLPGRRTAHSRATHQHPTHRRARYHVHYRRSTDVLLDLWDTPTVPLPDYGFDQMGAVPVRVIAQPLRSRHAACVHASPA